MSQQQPWGQQPQQPQWGAPPQQPGWGTPPPPPPRKSKTGRNIGLGCAGIVGLFVVIGVVGAAVGGGSNDDGTKSSAASPESAAKDKDTADTPKKDKPAEAKKDEKKAETPTVVFKVWGTAPAGALGPLDITYGSDSDSRKGKFENGKFEATLPLDDDALYFNVMAQLQGSGDINCSVTIDGKTEKGHAAGGYTICNAQANKGILGGWD